MAEEKEPKKGKRGGRREGAGRPKGDRRLFSFRIEGRLADYIDSHESRTDFIHDCIEEAYKSEEGRTKSEESSVSEEGRVKSEELNSASPASQENWLSPSAPTSSSSLFTHHSSLTFGDVWPATSVGEMTLPMFDNARFVAGFPLALDNDELAQDVEIVRMLCPHPEASYLIRVKGDSMIDAGIHDGDIIIVDKNNRTPDEHEVAVCELNGEYTIKHVVQEDGRAWLVPANPDYPRIEVREEDNFCVWGVVTYTIHKPRS